MLEVTLYESPNSRFEPCPEDVTRLELHPGPGPGSPTGMVITGNLG